MAGAPSSYIPEKTIFMAEKYLEEYKDNNELIPSIAGLALYLGVSRSTVHLWATQEDKKEFSDTLEKIKARQEVLLLSGGLGGTMNSTITKLALANHGYSDKIEADHTTNGESINKPTVIQLVAQDDNSKN